MERQEGVLGPYFLPQSILSSVARLFLQGYDIDCQSRGTLEKKTFNPHCSQVFFPNMYIFLKWQMVKNLVEIVSLVMVPLLVLQWQGPSGF